MPNEIPNAQRLIPSDDPNGKPPEQAGGPLGIPFAAKVAVIAVPIVVGGMVLALKIRSQVSTLPDSALNDTRSPLAEEISQPETASKSPSAAETNPNPPERSATNTGTDAPFDINEAYPDIDPNQEPLAVAVNPAIAGLSGSNAPTSINSPIPGNTAVSAKALYGHLPYDETRRPLSSAGSFIRENYERAERLDSEAAQAFEQMRQAAQAEGVALMPVSGFRTIADQKELFQSQINRKGSEAAAALFSAPPGHSEHHTGYAIDITDANYPESDIKQSFENTPAYQWLIANARAYGFEESFPKNNLQGVTFEPWHWRYVASENARQTFSDAQRLHPSR
ncbi:MAG: D-alanyl-D-alanine carboxypeptidase family protein [Phormidesmis sp.]